MKCDDVPPLLMGFQDGELPEEERTALEAHLAQCAACRGEDLAYRRLTEMTESIEFDEPTEAEWRAHWQQVYNRLERGVGWFFLSLGALLLLLLGAYHLLEDFFLDARHSIVLRLGVGAITVGGVVLAVSVVRERIRLYRVDRYEEVEL